MTPDEKRTRAILADQVLANPLFNEAFTVTNANLFDSWVNTKWFQFKKREKIWGMMTAAKEFKKVFEVAVQQGKNQSAQDQRSNKLRNVK